MNLKNKTVIITGSSRGIGREIALKCATDGANIVIIGKTTEPHAKLDGTIHSVAKEVTDIGGNALPIALDLRDDSQYDTVINQVLEQFKTIDILVNNASALLWQKWRIHQRKNMIWLMVLMDALPFCLPKHVYPTYWPINCLMY